MLFTDRTHGNFAKDPAVVRFSGQYFLYYSMATRMILSASASLFQKIWKTGRLPGK